MPNGRQLGVPLHTAEPQSHITPGPCCWAAVRQVCPSRFRSAKTGSRSEPETSARPKSLPAKGFPRQSSGALLRQIIFTRAS
jgi:hypothetical protein